MQLVDGAIPSGIGANVTLSVDKPRRNAIQRHHTVTHLLHWALHEVVSKEASQKGSFVGPDKLTFDFNSAPLTPQQVADIEKLVNERILENAGVSWTEVPYADVKSRKDVMQFFGDKYGDTVRVVQIGGQRGEAGRLFDGTVRRHAHARDGRDRLVPHRRRKRDCRRRPAHRSRCRPRSLSQGHRRSCAHQVARGQGEFARARAGKEDRVAARTSEGDGEADQDRRNSAKPPTPRAICSRRSRPSTACRPSSTISAPPTAIFCRPSPTR